MTCPKCEGKVTVTYSMADYDAVYRKRKCLECGHMFYTEESETTEAYVQFHRLACEKQERRKMKGSNKNEQSCRN